MKREMQSAVNRLAHKMAVESELTFKQEMKIKINALENAGEKIDVYEISKDLLKHHRLIAENL